MREPGYRISRLLIYVFFRLYNRLKVFAAHKIPEEGAVIVAANHASYLDPTVVGAAMRRKATFMAKEELFSVPLVRSFVSAWSVPVNRDNPKPSEIKKALKVLRQGGALVIFPEGGITRESPANDTKRGVGMLARMSRAQVVPAYICGTEKALPFDSWCIRPSRITVRFGEPVEPCDDDEKIAADVMKGIKNLRQENRAGC